MENYRRYPLGPDIAKYGGIVLVFLVTGIMLAVSYMRQYPALLSMAVVAFTLGLQHAFDVDHITAIDNITRKMINEGRNTHGVGFAFSLGHSSVVMLMAVATILFVTWSKRRLPDFQRLGGVIGTTFAGITLILLAVVNLVLLHHIWHDFRRAKHPQASVQVKKSIIYRIFERGLHLINHNWQVIGIGFLFGLGFDTASQIAVLATSAITTSQGVPWYAVLSFPLLFMAGMCLLDTSDGLFMSTAYAWVFASPIRKVYYNLVLTAVSVGAALFAGSVNLLLAAKLVFKVHSPLISWVSGLNFFHLGVGLVSLFIVLWVVALLGWHYLGVGKKDDAIQN
ncbi:HoxN/HupN/NixA family nickel/cobalt transporter [Levilactobacillus suantsaii]|nr:HoxN/HupN/NixA family nickel/cobalt transporter [Levilactobacillus suantsaii]